MLIGVVEDKVYCRVKESVATQRHLGASRMILTLSHVREWRGKEMAEKGTWCNKQEVKGIVQIGCV